MTALQLPTEPTILTCVRCTGSKIVAAAFIAAAVFVVASAAPPPVQGPRYSPPTLPTVAANQLDILGVEIQQNNLADAVRRLDSLLHDTPDALLSASDGGGTITLGTWIEALAGEQRTLLSKEYDVQFGDVAGRAVRKLNEKGSAEPAEFLAVARRYPLTSAASDAIASAARRCGELGDAQSMRDLLDLAHARGWNGDERATPNVPSTQKSATQKSATQKSGADHHGYRGLVP